MQDITPPVIVAWLKHPVDRVHVLLDRKGKTLSHAYVEMASQDAAKAALRSSQNSVLGRGKRARGVTVTRSNQEELMRAVSRTVDSVIRETDQSVVSSSSLPGRAISTAHALLSPA